MSSREELLRLQAVKLRRLWDSLSANPFYQEKLRGFSGLENGNAPGTSLTTWFRLLPFTTKQELAEDRALHPPFGSNLSLPLERYSRFCQSSGTTAGPIPTLDTPESWSAMLDVWDIVFRESGVDPRQTIFFAFSFGPFLGFWTAFEAATRRGNLAIPGGGLSSSARLQFLATYQPQVLCCTPTYALRLGQVLQEAGAPIQDRIRIATILVAGEPGGCIPATRTRISSLWRGARVSDHHGLTEVGPVSYESRDHPGSLLVAESAYVAEVLDPSTGKEVAEGAQGELVLTTLDRIDKPLLRYRTGDLVRKSTFRGQLCLEGGILGRIDDMLVIRGVNVYPGAVEQIVLGFPEVLDFEVRVYTRQAMTELDVRVEPRLGTPDPAGLARRIEVALSDAFALRFPVHPVSPGTLPRPEFKSKRWITS